MDSILTKWWEHIAQKVSKMYHFHNWNFPYLPGSNGYGATECQKEGRWAVGKYEGFIGVFYASVVCNLQNGV